MYRLYRRVLGLLAPEAPLAVVLVCANIAFAVAQFAEPVLFGRIIDHMNRADARHQPESVGDLAPLLAAWAGFALFSIAAAVLVALQSDRLAHRRRTAVMALYFEHVLHLPLSFHAATHSGRSLKVMLESAQGMFGLWLAFFRENCASLVALLILLPASLVINWRLGLLLIGLVCVSGAITAYVVHRTDKLQRTVERYNSAFAERASDALGNIPVIQSFTRVERETGEMRGIIQAVLRAQMPVLTWWAMMTVGTRAASTVALLGIFVLGAWLHGDGRASLGEIVTFMNFAIMLIARLESLVSFFNALLLQAPKLQDYFDVLDTAPLVADRPNARDPGRLAGAVRFEHVSFAYDGQRLAVADLDFVVAPGETIALVGATGSGKSTTLGLLHRVFDPQAGRITIDGIDIRDMTLVGLRRNIGVVFQEPMLFARSIEDNLRVGKPDATADEIAHALALAQATDFIATQSEGFATGVGERGRTLSGGERQRIAIARALLKDPPIMIFDEATSALDATTEQRLQRALEMATQGRTTFVIAHRLSTVRTANRILVFDHGRIVEAGTFDALVAQNGRFADLARAQRLVADPLPYVGPRSMKVE